MVFFGAIACSTNNNRPKYDPSIEPFGYESVAGSSLSLRQAFQSVNEMYNDGIVNTVLVVTPISDFSERGIMERGEAPRWKAFVAPCEVLAVIKNEKGPFEGPAIEVNDIVNIMEEMYFCNDINNNVILYRDAPYFIPLQKGHPYLVFCASYKNEVDGSGHLYWPSYGAFDISQYDATDYEIKSMTAPENAANEAEYSEALSVFRQFKKEASESVVFSSYFEKYTNLTNIN